MKGYTPADGLSPLDDRAGAMTRHYYRIYPKVDSDDTWDVWLHPNVVASCTSREAADAARRLLSGEAASGLIPPEITEVDIDGHVDDKDIQYIGKAIKQSDGTWRCLAVVAQCLTISEVRLTRKVL